MNHEIYMQRCLELAQNGLRAAMPNPSVGAVLVHEGRVIGEGHTSPYGGPHGEVNCINSVAEADRHLIPEATLYVSLEPCSHHGKTPPCCDLIIRRQIQNIIVGTVDPNEKVAGNGIKKLREAGKEVTVGILEKECREINRRFFTFHEKLRPYVILKWAESADGFLSPSKKSFGGSVAGSREEKKPVWITNSYSRQLVHKWRSEEAAILVGTQTVLDDNPQLDVRDWTGPDPVRIVLDRTGRISGDHSVKNQKIKTIVLTEKTDLTNLENLLYENVPFDSNLPKAIMEALHRHNLLSVIVEGGRQTLQTFIDAGLWDEARVFKGRAVFNDGTKAPILGSVPITRQHIQDDELLIFRNYDQHDNI
ncbi:bifunctional diaminohydroxyphosphoribosylaminopyrimidine deaminase/5-amino-6-(5-phosphoribosylamino)uracil reductase RibD [Flavobacterium sp. MFBS3-15]|uniref:bifunctional diaminohydroxyphosphoribosylaminopyrimidine deaminase/5-amino-6-(5-phosphoribosylamino)uracil reductase RibD n=1 Tax=Flavobacterium sp. MFBS3-15 TaxID=2989816 RepID=UPI0022362F04|nr:bifunctional diaminohydroxyphosphoribosylaminopyrimidine deaminase/5-amino-6-(5-phosphoribosylamino)uracil reductase RibD [Flavobacterium sp. MFBS3-15]MCW4468439.1 bifunctional diaminohydroxyphosphoribosylaminopyrimidine deaminase/5-amino-6-(5-phosphoribosylamino)uracil reductase RibD [Flavobacterium sp. MFBS3-15]